jgi:hypothetical protein
MQIFDIKIVIINKKLQLYTISILTGDNMKIFYLINYFENNFILAHNEVMLKNFINHIDNINQNSIIFVHNLKFFNSAKPIFK